MANFCSMDGCDRQSIARGWCRNHYVQWYRTGSPNPRARWSRPVRVRFTVSLWREWWGNKFVSDAHTNRLKRGIDQFRQALSARDAAQ